MNEKSCKDCLHYEVCLNMLRTFDEKILCSKFIDRSEWVHLPCKVGDTIYEVFMNHLPPFIQETTIEKIIITSKGLRIKLSRNSVYETSISALGKTIFFTREEAEKALEERKQ